MENIPLTPQMNTKGQNEHRSNTVTFSKYFLTCNIVQYLGYVTTSRLIQNFPPNSNSLYPRKLEELQYVQYLPETR